MGRTAGKIANGVIELSEEGPRVLVAVQLQQHSHRVRAVPIIINDENPRLAFAAVSLLAFMFCPFSCLHPIQTSLRPCKGSATRAG